MRAPAVVITSLVTLLAFGSLATAGVTVHHAKSVDFSQFRTFAWLEGSPAADAGVERQIRKAIETQLISKGLQRTDTEPDLFVRSLAGGHQSRIDDVDILRIPPGVDDSRDFSQPGGSQTRQVTMGTLVVLILDGQTRLQIWQGVATDILNDSPNRSIKKARKLIKRMFANFPPSPE